MARQISIVVLICLLLLVSCGKNNEEALENSTATDQKDLTVEEITAEEEKSSTEESTEPESEKNEEESEEETKDESGVRLPKDEF